MRAIWKGSITFGLVNVPVKLYSATEEHDLQLHQVHDADGGRIRYERRCEVCGRKVAYEHIDKAYDDGEQTVVLTEEDLESLPVERSREIEVVEFVPSEQIDPMLLDRSYYLEPDSKSPKAYVLLRRVLEETDRTAIVHLSLRQRTRLAALRVHDRALVVQTLRWADEIREAEFESLETSPRISARELELARSVVEDLEADFDPGRFEDDYQVQVQTLVDAKLEQGDAIDTAATFGEQEDDGEGAEVIDLMEALQRSVDARRGSGGKAVGAKAGTKDSGAKPAAKQPAARESAAKQTTTKKPAKQAAAEKAAAKKPAAKPRSKKSA